MNLRSIKHRLQNRHSISQQRKDNVAKTNNNNNTTNHNNNNKNSLYLIPYPRSKSITEYN